MIEYIDDNRRTKTMPNLMGQLNIFKSKDGFLRVRSKFRNWTENATSSFPILLPRTGTVLTMIINDFHSRMAHAGCFSVLAQVRKEFHIPKPFATVKGILKNCITCKKQNARAIKLNQ